MHLILAATSHTILADVAAAHRQLSDEQRECLTLSLFSLEDKRSAEEWERFERAVQSANLFIYDAHGANASLIESMTAQCDDFAVRVISMTSHHHQNTDEMLHRYWQTTGVHNWLQCLYYIERTYGNARLPIPEEPIMQTEIGIVDPRSHQYYNHVSDYITDMPFDQHKPIVAVFYMAFSSRLYSDDVVADIAARIRPYANVLPIGFPSAMQVDVDRLKQLLTVPGRRVNLIVNFIGFRLGAGPRGLATTEVVDWLTQLSVPVLHPYFLSRMDQEEWAQSDRGLGPAEFLVHVALPEMDGNIETYPVATMERQQFDPTYRFDHQKLVVIEERAQHLINRIRKWLALQQKTNADKKIALICYNYPPGEGHLFGGAFLDTFASISRLLHRLKEEGYRVEPMTAQQLRDQFLQGQLVNTGLWTDEHAENELIIYEKLNYEQRLSNSNWKGQMIEQWGEPPGSVMAQGDHFLIPGFCNGHVFIGLQPSRGIHENPDKVYHDGKLMPTHQYSAFYQWLREAFQADAIMHVGTHGTLEFLPGKQIGLSGDCFPDDMVGDIPHLYYYYVGNPSEGMIAKRRSHATLVSYQSPPFVEGELYGEFAELERLLQQYREAEQIDPDRCKWIAEQMQPLTKQLGLGELDMEQLERELYRMGRAMIPHGLHKIGQGLSPEDALKHMTTVLRHDRAQAPALRRLLASAQGMDYDKLLTDHDTIALAELDRQAGETVRAYVDDGTIPTVHDAALAADFARTLAYGRQAYEAALHNAELEGMLHALNGQYLPAKLSGDVMRNPDIWPTGYNMYQLDPRAVPSVSAVRRGAEIARNTIELYYKETGDSYPETTALVMWGIETARTQGETIGQILHYLGVRLGVQRNRFQTVYEIIPLSELGRPRLNIVVTISGIFRDTFPHLIEELHELFKRIARLDEPEECNLFKKRTNELQAALLADGYAEEEAFDLACARLFGPAEGQYGTGITQMIETKNWADEAQIGAMFGKQLGHVYSSSHHGKEAAKLFNAQLAAVDIVSQLRSTHEHEVVDLDHYYEYFGGLSRSIENVKGEKAKIYITDTTGETALTEDVRKSIDRGVRTRMLNPKWINALLEHPYHGAQEIAKRFENVLGLASTTDKVDEWVFSALHEAYVADEVRSKQIEENNRFAYHEMLETMLECVQRKYWHPTDDQLEQLQHKYMQLESEMEA